MIQHKIIENRMKSALKNEEFQIYLQPKYDISQNKIAGAEALVRWADPNRGLIPPNDFIPLFENNGFILDLDLYVFDRTCHLLRQWIDRGVNPVVISVNLSRAYLHDFTFLGKFEEIRRKYEVPSNLIELELTETVVFENMEILTDIINLIHDLGYSCSIDDFGSGYSSLNILKNIPVDTIKIDRGFFIGENSDTVKSDTIVRSVIDLARKLKMKTVSEGVEYKDQVDFLKEAKCDMIQGYYFSKPIPITEFEKLAFGLVISGKRILPSESQSDFVFQPEDYLESQQDFTESNFPASVILRKKSSDDE
jgi:EAL domain-containing protein (putative c-di-GMP-specific phosphodiesterase class I)